MTWATLSQVLRPCLAEGRAVAGFVVLGWEDAQAYVQAGEAMGRPVILQAGPGVRAHTPLSGLGAMFGFLAARASVPGVAHLDHGESLAVCAEAVACGFTSVMYDGSRLRLAENVARTAKICAFAQGVGVSVKAELGFVCYAGEVQSVGTDPAEVVRFVAETGVDALAVSVGNSHLMQVQGAAIDRSLLRAIETACPGLPLVLHGDRASRRPSGWLWRERRQCASSTSAPR